MGFLEVPKARLDGVLGSLSWEATIPWQGLWLGGAAHRSVFSVDNLVYFIRSNPNHDPT